MFTHTCKYTHVHAFSMYQISFIYSIIHTDVFIRISIHIKRQVWICRPSQKSVLQWFDMVIWPASLLLRMSKMGNPEYAEILKSQFAIQCTMPHNNTAYFWKILSRHLLQYRRCAWLISQKSTLQTFYVENWVASWLLRVVVTGLFLQYWRYAG